MNPISFLLACVVVTCIFPSNGRADLVDAWGDNGAGQLGNGTQNVFPTMAGPAPVIGMSGNVSAIGYNAKAGFAIVNGTGYIWGNNSNFAPAPIAGFSSATNLTSCGDYHGLAVLNGGVVGWGANTNGELTNTLLPIPGTQLYKQAGLSSGVSAVAAGEYYSLAVQNGAAYGWGGKWHGQLGNGTTSSSPTSTPTLLTGLSSGVTAISAGGSIPGNNGVTLDGTFYSFGLAIKGGAVYSWGDNRYGQLGNGTATSSLIAEQVSNLSSGVTAIVGGNTNGLALQDGNVYAWGNNYAGQLGDGTTTTRLTPELIDPTELNNIVQIASAGVTSFALSADGSIWDWGGNYDGELGLGPTSLQMDYLTPQHLLPPTGYRFTAVSANPDGASIIAIVAAVPEPTSLSFLTLAGMGLLGRSRKLRQ